MNRQGYDYQFDPNKYEVLRNLQDGRGFGLGNSLIASIYDNAIKGIVFIGEGGSGKTTSAGQAIRLLNEQASNSAPAQSIIPIFYTFEEAIIRTRQQLAKHESTWNENDWPYVSNSLHPQINEALDRAHAHNEFNQFLHPLDPKWKIFNDSVVVGPLDKGKSAVKQLVQRREKDVKVYGFITDPLNQQRAFQIREMGEIFQGREEEIDPQAVEKKLKEAKVMVDIDTFARVPSLMHRMGREDVLRRGNGLIEAEIDTLIGQGIDMTQYPLPEPVIERLRERPGNLDDHINYFQRRYAHMKYVLSVELGAGQTRSEVVFNLHMPDTQIHWYQTALEKSFAGGSS